VCELNFLPLETRLFELSTASLNKPQMNRHITSAKKLRIFFRTDAGLSGHCPGNQLRRIRETEKLIQDTEKPVDKPAG